MDWMYLLAYLLIQMVVVIVISRRIKDEKDYLLAGRNVPMFLLAFSIFATWFGAETCIAASANVFTSGFSESKGEPIAYALCLLIMGLVIAPKIWNEKYSTLGDFFQDKYGKTVAQIAIWILICDCPFCSRY
jgi:Na+/proline symporter